jgi:hypothetical protein
MTSRVEVLALWCVLFVLLLVLPAAAQTPSAAGSANAQRAQAYGRLPLIFEPNQGQTSPEVKFLARGPGYGLFLTDAEMVLALRQPAAGSPSKAPRGKEGVLRMQLVGGNRKPQIAGDRLLPGKSNYFTGHDPAKWRRNVPQFSGVRYRGVYPGVDVVYYGSQQQLEYDFVVAPGANPRSIRLRFSPLSSMKINSSGDLVLAMGPQKVSVRAPAIYQEIDGARQPVTGRFVVTAGREVGFDIGRYDRSRALVIDPTIVYSTYLGGSLEEDASAAVDPAGNVYLSGRTNSPNFPMTSRLNEISEAYPGHSSAFVAKLNSNGGSLAYSTFVDLGGVGFDHIAVDPDGQAIVTGTTHNANVPLVNAVQSTCPPDDYRPCASWFVLKLGAEGNTIVYSTFLGRLSGSPGLYRTPSIAADSDRNTYLAGTTTDPSFPLVNALQGYNGDRDAVVVKLNATGGWVYSTYLGGGSGDEAAAVAADADGSAYVIGHTDSTDFPTVNAAQPAHAPVDFVNGVALKSDAFVAKLKPDGSGLVYSTYLGGSGMDSPSTVVVNSTGTAWVVGRTTSSDFPTSPERPTPSSACVSAYGPCEGAGFLVKVGVGGQILYSTGVHLAADGLAVDSAENVYIAGSRGIFDWPLVNPLMSAVTPVQMGYHLNVVIEKLDLSATTVLFSTIWGGTGDCRLPISLYRPTSWPCRPSNDQLSYLGLDGEGNIYAIGHTTNDDFPTLNAFQPMPGGPPEDYGWCGIIEECRWYSENDDLFLVKMAQQDNTPAGQQITVAPADGATISFENVASPGTTSFARTMDFTWAPPPPDGFRLGDPPVFYEISTTASYTGGITVCVDYGKVSFSVEWGLRLFHYEDGIWKDITIRPVDTATNRICGVATSLSPFAIFGAPLPPIDVAGFAAPLASLVATGGTVSWPDKAFKLGRTLPLKLQLLVNGAPLTDQEVQGPKIVEVSRQGDPVLNLDTIDLNTGAANDNGLAFRFSDGSWVYNLSTQGLSPGRYVITIQLWDGRRLQGGFELKR